jgi:hypothetical protein
VAVKFIRLELALIDEVVGLKSAEAVHPAMNKFAVIVPLAAFSVFTRKLTRPLPWAQYLALQ